MLGERIKKLRENKELSQGKLARTADISNDYMHKIESGKVTNIGIEVIESLGRALEVHPSLILFGEILTPKIPANKLDKVGPLEDQEKALILKFRSIKSKTQRRMVEDLIAEFSK